MTLVRQGARISAILAISTLVSACSGGAATSVSPSVSQPTSAPSAASARSVAVKLLDALEMDPGELTVKVGETVQFVVTNAGAINHEFFIGDTAAQDVHEEDMMKAGGTMMHDEENGITVPPGQTKKIEHTFDCRTAHGGVPPDRHLCRRNADRHRRIGVKASSPVSARYIRRGHLHEA